jgi:hypothetical protein
MGVEEKNERPVPFPQIRCKNKSGEIVSRQGKKRSKGDSPCEHF